MAVNREMPLETNVVRPAVKAPELLAPAGNWDCAIAAVENGANAIYFGLDKFNEKRRLLRRIYGR